MRNRDGAGACFHTPVPVVRVCFFFPLGTFSCDLRCEMVERDFPFQRSVLPCTSTGKDLKLQSISERDLGHPLPKCKSSTTAFDGSEVTFSVRNSFWKKHRPTGGARPGSYSLGAGGECGVHLTPWCLAMVSQASAKCVPGNQPQLGS